MNVMKAREAHEPSRKALPSQSEADYPMLVLSGNGKIQFMTPEAQQMLDYTDSVFERVSFFSLVHHRNLYQVMRDISEMVCNGKKKATWDLWLKTARGHWRWFKIQVHNRLTEDIATLQLVIHETYGAEA